MISYFLIDATGFITQTGQCTVEAELPPNPIIGEVPFGATHYINGQFETKPNIDWLTLKALEQRQALLVGSDWTQLADVNVDKEAWAEYRQHLRDVPEQSGFPITIDWGKPPQGE
jgi:hypothetical protein